MPHMSKLSSYRTTVANSETHLIVTYAETAIVIWSKKANTIKLDTGGWKTVTTKRKMNQTANQYGLGFGVRQERGEWYYQESRTDAWHPFFNNDVTIKAVSE